MNQSNFTLKRINLGTTLSFCLLVLSVHAAWEPDPAFGLGEAGQFAVLSLGKPTAETDGQSKLDLSQATIFGDVGVGPHGTLDFQGPSVIKGDLYLDHTLLPQDILTDEGTVEGQRFSNADLDDAVQSALDAAESNALLAPTQVFGRISTSTSIYGTGGLNVVSIEGIDYARSSVTTPLALTLNGGGDDLFVLQVSGKFVLGPNASIRGVDPSRVLIHIGQGNTPVQFAANSYVGGTLLSPYRKMGPLQGASGPVIGARVQEISLVGGAVLNPPPQSSDPVAVIIADQAVSVATPVQLDGSASSTPSGEPLEYDWSLPEVPTGSMAVLVNPTGVAPYFTPDLAGDYVVQLVVSDSQYTSEAAMALITAVDPSEAPDLALAIADDPDPVVKKATLTYTLTITNNGMLKASDVMLHAALVGAVRGTPVVEPITDPDDQCSYSLDSGLTCSLGELFGGETALLLVRVVPKKAGFFAMDGIVSSAIPDLEPSDNTDVEQTTVLRY